MTARTTMANLITTLRGFTNAGTADYSVGSATFWSDDQLQGVLDRYATPIREEPLTVYPVTNTSGTVEYKEYQSHSRFFEDTNAGTARFFVADSLGALQGTANWSADYEKGLITFAADTKGTAYYLTGYAYDVYAAAADVWYQKAAHASEQFDFSTSVNKVTRSHVVTGCLTMAKRYEAMASVSTSQPAVIARGDLA